MSIIFCPMVTLEFVMPPLPLRLLTPLALLVVLSGCNSKADSAAQAPTSRPVLAATVEAAGTQRAVGPAVPRRPHRTGGVVGRALAAVRRPASLTCDAGNGGSIEAC